MHRLVEIFSYVGTNYTGYVLIAFSLLLGYHKFQYQSQYYAQNCLNRLSEEKRYWIEFPYLKGQLLEELLNVYFI